MNFLSDILEEALQKKPETAKDFQKTGRESVYPACGEAIPAQKNII